MRLITALLAVCFAACANAADVVLYSTTAPTAAAPAYPGMVSQTGQTNTYLVGDDGSVRAGVAIPTTRFTVLSPGDFTNAVRDNLTGLVWAKNTNISGVTNWFAAVSNCNDLVYGGYSDWRLPNISEMWSLLDHQNYGYVLPTGHPFIGLVTDYYWTATTGGTVNPTLAKRLRPYTAQNDVPAKTGNNSVWPVRGP